MSFSAAIVLPTYNETDSLIQLLEELVSVFENDVIYLIVDDSEDARSSRVASTFFSNYPQLTHSIIESRVKRGRGDAVLRGIKFMRTRFGSIKIIEMDSDGSHSVVDALKILEELKNGSHFVIGSRYLSDSEISGWPKSRLFFSQSLNKTLSVLFGLPITDWTNGLRGYSERSSLLLVQNTQIVTGFTYLSEQILVLSQSDISPKEIPSRFRNRTHGTSSVGLRELRISLMGILRLYRAYH